MASRLRLVLVLMLIVPITLALVPVQVLVMTVSRSWSRKIPVWWHRLVLWLTGVRVHQHGQLDSRRPLMIVANHVSWADILVLGSIGEICFVAKDEVRTMPGVSQLARLQRTVFVRREKKREAAVQADTIASRLLEGDAMVLFPEGTTGNGNKLLGFKSALFGAPLMAMEQAGIETIFVQPVAIAYNTLHGMPLGRYHQTMASWPGDIELAPHLAEFFRQGAFDVDVSLGECISVDNTATRKEITARCFEAVRQEFSKMRRLYHRD